jgi:4'-phosphopantetheinyl transferase
MALQLTPWQYPLSQPELTAEAVHLWRFPLVCQDPLEHLLDEEELQRAQRLRVPDKAQAFVVARARLRQILANYLGLDPKALRFTYGPSGKPVLAGLADPPAFNLAHSGEWGLCAVTSRGEVGVDVEVLDFGLDYAKLAERFFSAAEKKWLRECPAWRRRRHFFRIWTRKEAWLKGKGGGFSEPDQDIGPVHLSGCSTFDGNWWLRSFPVARHYLASLALSREFSYLQRWNGWQGPDGK